MPRRTNEADVNQLLKKKKVIEEPISLDVSFCDDEALLPGIIFADVLQKKWRLGKPIGRGSFGRIYLASDDIEKEVNKLNARYVVKIEPHLNGPLFVEIHCLIRTAQVSKVKVWCQQNKLKRLGMPVYIASGSFVDENTNTKYRFLVLPRYDIDLQKIISRTKVLELKNVLLIALQILNVLEYFHNQGYTHSDIKSSNLMLGFDGNRFNKNCIKPTPSYQKDTKQLVLFSRKHKKSKPNKSRNSNYYDDEDFTIRSPGGHEFNNETEIRLASVKKKLRKFLSDRDTRTLHRHHAFNLRQLSNYVNYEDLNSSVCSDKSYQNLEDFGNIVIPPADRTKINKIGNDINNDEISHSIEKEAIYSQSNGQLYLLDYGLASKFLDTDGKHKDFGMDARKAHDGTLEYSSRDSHIGAHSRRSDLETLGYNLIDWLTGTLPWKTTEVLAEPDLVHVLKKNFMADIKSLLKTCFKTEFYPQFLEKYFQYVVSLDFSEKPDYEYCKSLFKSELLKNGYVFDKEHTVNFENMVSPMSRKFCYSKKFGRKNTPSDFLSRNGIKKPYERENLRSLEYDLKLELLKQTLNTSTDGIRKPCTSRNFFISDADLVARLKKTLMVHDIFGKKLSPKNLRSNKNKVTKRKGVKKISIGKFGKFMGSAKQFSWAEILAGNPENIIRKDRNTANDGDTDDATCRYRIRKLSNASSDSSETNSPLLQKDYLQDKNPTYAMKEVIANLKKKISGKSTKELEDPTPGLEKYTPIMIKIYKLKEKREAKERLEINKKLSKESIDKKENIPTTRLRSNRAKPTQPQLKATRSSKSQIVTSDTDHHILKEEEVKTKDEKGKSKASKSKKTQKISEIDLKSNENVEKPLPDEKLKSKVCKKTVKIVLDDIKNVQSPKKTVRKCHVTTNRRRLRSSKRKK